MSRVKRSGSVMEQTFGSALWRAGVRYRKQYKKLPGCPDFAVVWARVAIFCDSAFWHGRGWPKTSDAIKSNRAFWIVKIERNIQRDAEVGCQLHALGWQVIRFWDKEIFSTTEKCVARVLAALETAKTGGKG